METENWKRYRIIFGLIVVTMLLVSCEKRNITEPSKGFEVIREGGNISIVDQTGKVWDITHAFDYYNFDPGKFDFGLGPAAILPINNPQFFSPGETGYPAAANDFLVIGYKDEKRIRAYSLNILVHHEVVNDMYDKLPVAVAYCPLVNLTAVYNRQIFGQTVTLSASGWTYDETFILYDIETESLWYPLPGKSGLTCINGHHADKSLAELPSSQMRWADWFTENPGTKYLKSPK